MTMCPPKAICLEKMLGGTSPWAGCLWKTKEAWVGRGRTAGCPAVLPRPGQRSCAEVRISRAFESEPRLYTRA